MTPTPPTPNPPSTGTPPAPPAAPKTPPVPPPMPTPGGSKPTSKKMLIIILVAAVLLIGGGAGAYFMFFQDDSTPDTNTNQVTNTESTTNDATNDSDDTMEADEDGDADEIPLDDDNVNATAELNTNGSPELNTNDAMDDLDDLFAEFDFTTDEDEDELPVVFEEMWGTSDSKKDTDGDGFSDSDEITGCYNPNGDGTMDRAYFSNTYCPNMFDFTISWASSMSEAETDEIEALDKIVPDLCSAWSDYADEYSEMYHSGEDGGEALVAGTAAYDDACDETDTIIQDSSILDVFSDIGEEVADTDEFCELISELVVTMCTEVTTTIESVE